MTYFIWAETILVPVLGLLWYGIKSENDRHERLLRASLRALGVIAIARGKK